MTIIFIGCSKEIEQQVELKHYPLDNLENIISQADVEVDAEVTFDGNGAIKITSEDSTTVMLYEVHDIAIEDARLIYQAKLKTEDVVGKAYLEMLCHFPEKGEFFSKGLASRLAGTRGWTTVETPFFLKKGEKPDYVKLNVVLDGSGTIWIDDIRLIKGPLE
ncbi:MAG: hypothetical protein GY855_05490 [candidate division Zixibacteria bacterium]|nr:hypothetical protein [candidate division Zixibacteria bacterium]